MKEKIVTKLLHGDLVEKGTVCEVQLSDCPLIRNKLET